MIPAKIYYTILFSGLLIIGSCSNNHDYLVTIKTNYGDIKLILFDKTPDHRENFLKLANKGFYDSLLFHRVIADFMIQTGDPNSKPPIDSKTFGKGSLGFR